MGVGAVMGARKGSRPSLIAGSVLGGAFLFSGYAINKGDYDIGFTVAAGISLSFFLLFLLFFPFFFWCFSCIFILFIYCFICYFV